MLNIKRHLSDVLQYFFSHEDIRITLFNTFALSAILIATLIGIYDFFYVSWINALIDFLMLSMCAGLLIYLKKTGKYQRCYLFVIIFIFFLAFPYLFFLSGGYQGGMPAFFIFGIVFTVLMLDRKFGLIMAFGELCIYVSACFIAYYYPQHVVPFTSEFVNMLDVVVALTLSSAVCAFYAYLYLKKYEEQKTMLAEQNKQLHLYNMAKSTFLTTVAHEIRNPLTAISVNTRDTKELLGEAIQEKELIDKNLQTVENIVLRIDKILTDLMDTVSVEQGRFQLRKESILLKEVLEEAVDIYSLDVKLKKNTICLHAPTLGPIMADHSRILQVMINLLSNSQKYTQNGSITISLNEDDDFQSVSVIDTGEGMDENIRQEVFKNYVSLSKEYWRHGIGLYVCHQIIDAHGGTISLESHTGQGTSVLFRLPKVSSS